MNYSVSIAGDKELRDCRETWNHIAARMRLPSIFCTWEWIYTWWEVFGKCNRPVILHIKRGTELKGILPLAVRWAFLNQYWATGRVLEFCGAKDLYPDHLDIICAPEDENICAKSIFGYFSRMYRGWDVLQLDLMQSDSPLATWSGTPGENGAHPYMQLRNTSKAHYLPIDRSFEEYFGGFEKKRRYNLMSRRKKLLEGHGMRYLPCEPAQEREGLELLFELHRLRARRKGLRSSFDRPVVRAFHGALVERMRPMGWIALRFLQSERETIAVSYNFTYCGRVFSFQKGIDPRWERYGPGTVLYYDLIREAFTAGMIEYNFLHGDESYKAEWTPSFRQLVSLAIFRGSPLGKFSRAMISAKERLRDRIVHNNPKDNSR